MRDEEKPFDSFLSSNKLDCKVNKLLYGRFYIELSKNVAKDNNPVIFIVSSSFLENSNSRQLEPFF